ncbi:MAG: formylmethanofuran dehydrogenase subunit B [Planctomycetaceae bacterium]
MTGPRRQSNTAFNDGGLVIIDDVTCTACGCMCDDMSLQVDPEANRVCEATRACALGREHFLRGVVEEEPEALIDGQAVSYSAAIERTVELLLAADFPLIDGLEQTSTKTQRLAVAIADRVRGCLDTATSRGHAPTIEAMQRVGEVTCTFGELRHRADLLIFWGCDPVTTHPRHFERYSLEAPSASFPCGRQDRYAVSINSEPTATGELVDWQLRIKQGADVEVAWTLRGLAKGLALDAVRVEKQTGVPLVQLQQLMSRMQEARYGAIVFGSGVTHQPGGDLAAEGVLCLVREMNRHTRFVASPLRGADNVSGADDVLSWSTGYPFGVSFHRGYPQYNPGEYTSTELLSRKETDVALIVSTDLERKSPEGARSHLSQIPHIVIGPRASTAAKGASVCINTSRYGLQSGGTVSRADEVTLPLRPALTSYYRPDSDVLEDILRRFPKEE